MQQRSLNILVTGGAGFIGSALISKLQSLGHAIYVIDNLSFGNRKFLTIPDTHFYEIDILDQPALMSAMQAIAPSWVIHLAAIHFIPYCNQHPTEASRINIQGTINVLNAAKKLKNLEKLFLLLQQLYIPSVTMPFPKASNRNPLTSMGSLSLQGSI